MDNEKIEIEEITSYWLDRSDSDFETMINLMRSKDYHWALFVGHLVIERLLKAYFVRKIKKHAPFTHDLRRLAKLTELKMEDEQIKWLDTISTFNLNARYDDYKQDFYKKCTFDYADTWISKIKILRKWIKKKL